MDRLEVGIGLGSAGAEGPIPVKQHVLALEHERLVPWLGGLCAVIGGSDSEAEQVRTSLECVFGRGQGLKRTPETDVGAYLAAAIGTTNSSQPADVAVCIWQGNQVWLAWSGGAGIYKVHESRVTNMADKGLRRAGSVFTASASLSPEDRIVLIDAVIAETVSARELEQTVRSSSEVFSAQDGAEWLVALGAGRATDTARAAVLQFMPHTVIPQRTRRRVTHQVIPFVSGVALVALITGLVLHGRAQGSPPARPQASGISGVAQIPRGLVALEVAPTRAVLAWQRVPHAIGYLVHVDHHMYRSTAPRLALRNVLSPGQRHRWGVQAQFAHHVGAEVLASPLDIPVRGPFPWVAPVSPQRVVVVGRNGNVSFCWRVAITADRSDLYLTSGKMHVHRSFAKIPPNRVACTVQRLQPRAYAWQVGAVARGYGWRWTHWQYVWVNKQRPQVARARRRATSGRAPATAAAPAQVTYQPPAAAAPVVVPTAVPAPAPAVAPAPARVAAPAPAPVYRPVVQPTAVIYRAPPVVVRPTAAVVRQQPQPAAPVQPPAAVAQPTPAPPQPAPTPPVVSCPNPPNCS